MQVMNDRPLCGVRLVHMKEEIAPHAGLSKISILKYDAESAQWDLFYQKDIEAPFDADFILLDMYVRAGESYSYKLRYTLSNESDGEISHIDIETGTYEIEVAFDGIFLGNANAQYVCITNQQLSHQKNTPVAYIQTYYSKYPKSIYNGSNDYETGSAQGIFTPFNAAGEPIYEDNAKYRRDMKAFLANGKPKVLKTVEGNMWMVQIDSGFSEEYQGYLDGTDVKFNWTEIADTPKTDCAVVIR